MLRPIKISNYLAYLQARGYPAEALLAGTGLRQDQLSDPDCLLDRPQSDAVVANMIRLTGNPAIGFDIAEQAEVADFGLIGHAMRTSRTLGDAISYWIHYSNLVGMMVRLTLLDERDQGWTVVFAATEPLGETDTFRFWVEEILVLGTRVGSALVAQSLPVAEVRVSYPPPAHAERYRAYFRCPVRFNAERCSIRVRGPQLSTPLPGFDAELNELYRRRCREVLRAIGGDDPLPARLRALFLSCATGLPTETEAARRLGMSQRTLRRRLQEDGTGYQRLLRAFREDRCRDYLASGVLSNKEIAALLGFRDANSLHRAFRAWTGCTLGAARVSTAHERSAEPRQKVQSKRRP